MTELGTTKQTIIDLRRKRIVDLRKDNPCMTGTAIASIVGTSREYVRQVLVKQGLPNAKFTQHEFICNNCGGSFPSKRVRPLYCSRKCMYKAHRVNVLCSECSQMFEIRRSDLLARMRGPNNTGRKTDDIFCSKRCQGKWLARNFGFRKGHLINVRRVEMPKVAKLRPEHTQAGIELTYDDHCVMLTRNDKILSRIENGNSIMAIWTGKVRVKDLVDEADNYL